jgi:hypothetical protein
MPKNMWPHSQKYVATPTKLFWTATFEILANTLIGGWQIYRLPHNQLVPPEVRLLVNTYTFGWFWCNCYNDVAMFHNCCHDLLAFILLKICKMMNIQSRWMPLVSALARNMHFDDESLSIMATCQQLRFLGFCVALFCDKTLGPLSHFFMFSIFSFVNLYRCGSTNLRSFIYNRWNGCCS